MKIRSNSMKIRWNVMIFMKIRWILMIFHENPMKFKHFLWKSDEIWWSQINQTRGWNDRFRVGPTRVSSTRPGVERLRSETIVSGSDQGGQELKRSFQDQINKRRGWNDRFRHGFARVFIEEHHIADTSVRKHRFSHVLQKTKIRCVLAKSWIFGPQSLRENLSAI